MNDLTGHMLSDIATLACHLADLQWRVFLNWLESLPVGGRLCCERNLVSGRWKRIVGSEVGL